MTVAEQPARLSHFPTSVLDQTAADLDWLVAGVRIHFVVDPHEIIEYCFPFGLQRTQPSLETRHDPDVVADSQAALYELLYNWPTPPVLINEYVHEILRNEAYLRWQAPSIYKDLEIIQSLVRSGDLSMRDALDRDRLLQLVEKEFTLALAVTIGLFSSGVHRLSEICRTRLLRDDNIESVMIRDGLRRYEPSPLFQKIFSFLRRTYPEPADPDQLKRQNRGFETDATVIDKVIQLNGLLLAEAERRNSLPEHVFMYLSSAERSRLIFGSDSLRAAHTPFRGAPFNPLRTRQHLFAYLVHKRRTHPLTRAALGRTRNLMDDERAGLVSRARVSDELTDIVRSSRARIANLNVAANVGEYERLYGKAQSLIHHTKPGQKVEAYFRLFEEVFNHRQGGFEDLALQWMEDLTKLTTLDLSRQDEVPAGTNGGQVTVIVQRLPIAPRFSDPECAEIFAHIREYFVSPPGQQRSRRRFMETALARFRVLERGEPHEEHELLRCLLYIAFPEVEGDQRAYEQAIAAARLAPRLEQEFLYVACWAARRRETFREAVGLAGQGTTRYPDDPRFYHAQALNLFAWIQREGADQETGRSYALAVDHAEAAVRLYREHPRPEARDLISANLHNVAYISAMDSATGDGFDLKRARRAIDDLKRVTPQSEWSAKFPEYHQGEALVEFREYEQLQAQQAPRQKLCEKLGWAHAEVLRAGAAGYQTNAYRQLREDIERAMARNGCPHPS